MKEATFRRPLSQEGKEKQGDQKKQVKTDEHKEADRIVKKKLAEYFHPVYGWKGINRSPSYWDRIKEQRRKKRKMSETSKRGNRTTRNDKRRKAKRMRRV